MNLFILKKINFLKGLFSIDAISIQKIHAGFSPKIGGILIYITLIVYSFTDSTFSNFLKNILFFCIPFFFIISYEDLTNRLNYFARLIVICLTSLSIIVFNITSYPVIDLPFISVITTEHRLAMVISLTLCLTGLINAYNFIDGANGFLYFVSFGSILSLLYISNHIGDFQIIIFLEIFLYFLTIQFLFNFPSGKIFFGDFGAYFIGLILGYVSIIIFAKHPNLITSLVILIFAIPIYEFCFTIVRRLISNKSIFVADNLHLHHLIYDFLLKKLKNKILANNLVSIILLPLIFLPYFWIRCFGFMSYESVLTGLIVTVCCYHLFYFYFKIYDR